MKEHPIVEVIREFSKQFAVSSSYLLEGIEEHGENNSSLDTIRQLASKLALALADFIEQNSEEIKGEGFVIN